MKLLSGLCVCVLLCGCGIKPGQVHAPNTENEVPFPGTYPDLRHDPQALEEEDY